MTLCAHKDAGASPQASAMHAGSSPVRRRDGAGAGFVITVGIKQRQRKPASQTILPNGGMRQVLVFLWWRA